jgi:hypothetical protein
MPRQRRHYAPEQKVALLHPHLLEKKPISDIRQEHGLAPNLFYLWQKQLFESGTAAFDNSRKRRKDDRLGGPLAGQGAGGLGQVGDDKGPRSGTGRDSWPAAARSRRGRSSSAAPREGDLPLPQRLAQHLRTAVGELRQLVPGGGMMCHGVVTAG